MNKPLTQYEVWRHLSSGAALVLGDYTLCQTRTGEDNYVITGQESIYAYKALPDALVALVTLAGTIQPQNEK